MKIFETALLSFSTQDRDGINAALKDRTVLDVRGGDGLGDMVMLLDDGSEITLRAQGDFIEVRVKAPGEGDQQESMAG